MLAAAVEATRQATEAVFNDFEHTGPDTLLGRYLRTYWHPVSISEQLKPGWAVSVKIMHEPFTLYRGETGTMHGADFRCCHRGTQPSTGWCDAGWPGGGS